MTEVWLDVKNKCFKYNTQWDNFLDNTDLKKEEVEKMSLIEVEEEIKKRILELILNQSRV
jgi:hypothetical protein